MAEAPSLGDFFKSKSKKKVKASNLNKDSTTTKTEETKKKTTTKEDEAWEEEKVEASTIQVAVAGKLMREEEKKDDDDTSAPAWGDLRKQASSNAQINEKRYPTLAKSVGAINVDDGEGRVNIQTSKNHFAALEGNEDSDDDGASKRPKNIVPAMVSKKKGEFAKAAVQREVEKVKKDAKKKAKKEGDEEEEDEEEEEEEEEAEEQVEEQARSSKKKPSEKKEEKKDDKKVKRQTQEEANGSDVAEDLKIQVDLVASKEKYKGRKKLPAVDLPVEELEENKENKQKQNAQPSGGKKKKMFVEEETDKKLSYAPF